MAGRRRTVDLPPWQTDATYRIRYGRPENVFAIVMVPTTEDALEGGGEGFDFGEGEGGEGEIVIRLDPPPETWKELRAEQRAQLAIYGSTYMPYSRGYAPRGQT